jgi:hypothetical protein
MPTPLQYEQYAELMRQTYADAETRMLETVAKRLARGIEYEGWAELKLAEVQALNREIKAQVKSLGGNFENLGKAVEGAYQSGSAQAIGELGTTQIANIAADVTALDRYRIRTLIGAATDSLRATHLRILRTAQDAYRTIVTEAAAQVVTGTASKWPAVQAGLNRFADQGITGFVDSAGKRWSLQSYTEMAVRTATTQASVEGHVNRLSANGFDLVRISDHAEECPLCRPFEGQVFSSEGKTPGYPTLESARAAGLFHPNCGHSVGIYIEGVSKPRQTEANPQLYEERQQQRSNERQIRKWKNRQAVAGDPESKAQAAAKVKEWQARQREFINATGRRRESSREQLRAGRPTVPKVPGA